jgi:hypothetical protein
MISARLKSALESCDNLCRGLYEIWLQLILQRNQGLFTRDDVNFIMERVNACVQAQIRNVSQALGQADERSREWAASEARTKMESVASGIARELEIKFREQEAFGKQKGAPDLSFGAFLRAFGDSWLTKMSGPLTVPFTIGALLLPGLLKSIFAILAITSGVFSSYHVWRNARADAFRQS